MSKIVDGLFTRKRREPKGVRDTYWLKKHNMCETPLYYVWQAMKQRCYNKNNPRYKIYGGRGIRVCDKWLNNFAEFAKWAIESGYDTTLTIDRINVNGDYCPENCRWATKEQQNNNMTKNIFIEYCGETLSISQWAKKIGINRKTLDARLKKGWSIEKSLTTPVDNFYKRNYKK